jgi:hypothetical protein
MRRVISVLVVAGLMAAMMVTSALPAFAKPAPIFPGEPGNSGAAGLCKRPDLLADLKLEFKNRGECVSFFAHGAGLSDQ